MEIIAMIHGDGHKCRWLVANSHFHGGGDVYQRYIDHDQCMNMYGESLQMPQSSCPHDFLLSFSMPVIWPLWQTRTLN